MLEMFAMKEKLMFFQFLYRIHNAVDRGLPQCWTVK